MIDKLEKILEILENPLLCAIVKSVCFAFAIALCILTVLFFAAAIGGYPWAWIWFVLSLIGCGVFGGIASCLDNM